MSRRSRTTAAVRPSGAGSRRRKRQNHGSLHRTRDPQVAPPRRRPRRRDDQSFEKRPYPPGQHGRARIKESEYRQQLQEKQKARFTYGVMEKQFRRYYEEANAPFGQDR